MSTKEMLPNWIGGLSVPCSKQEKLRLGVVGLWVPNLHHFEMSVHPACPVFLTTKFYCTQSILQVVKLMN